MNDASLSMLRGDLDASHQQKVRGRGGGMNDASLSMLRGDLDASHQQKVRGREGSCKVEFVEYLGNN